MEFSLYFAAVQIAEVGMDAGDDPPSIGDPGFSGQCLGDPCPLQAELLLFGHSQGMVVNALKCLIELLSVAFCYSLAMLKAGLQITRPPFQSYKCLMIHRQSIMENTPM